MSHLPASHHAPTPPNPATATAATDRAIEPTGDYARRMSDFNQTHNRAVWFDIPVADLDRAIAFYRAVLAIAVDKVEAGDTSFAVLAHEHGNGGCLVPNPAEVIGDKGLLLYLNTEGRIRAAVAAVTEHGGKILEDVHPIGPHGFRAIIHDSEGNRLVLHSMSDA